MNLLNLPFFTAFLTGLFSTDVFPQNFPPSSLPLEALVEDEVPMPKAG